MSRSELSKGTYVADVVMPLLRSTSKGFPNSSEESQNWEEAGCHGISELKTKRDKVMERSIELNKLCWNCRNTSIFHPTLYT
ncbi:15186_t:CDS:2 [Cetraspora pellucida]|uniref:15186_t:CDS:1 n=1 Tax=Cetraspora pellucida TaxID=1433469 RepID=A0A9N9BTF3_9GLOM|nr:15186_t:CDS:2 [Cetraspora pellucida]